jgi:hypothetical protein
MPVIDKSGIAAINTRDHNDETALSQLGAATVLLWSKIPDVIRQEMLLLTEEVEGLRKARDCSERLARLIEGHSPQARRLCSS